MVNLKKAIYLDVDILVRKDISDLWSIDIENYPLAARISIHDSWKKGVSLSLEIAERFSYIKARKFRQFLFENGNVNFDAYNAGVLVLNLNYLRSCSATEKMLSIAYEFGLHDQFCLNILTRGNYVHLDKKWNYFYSQENLDDPSIVHYIGKMKPWAFAQLPYANEWRSYMI